MEDENADRVYVPGTSNGATPDRDVEPFWPPEELDATAPVHGGRPVPHDAPPPRPVTSVSVPPPPPPPVQPEPSPPVFDKPAPAPTPTPWASLGAEDEPPPAPAPGPDSTTSAGPDSPAPGPDGKAPSDSPWAQPPPHRSAQPAPPAPAPGPPAPPAPAPEEHRARATASVPPPPAPPQQRTPVENGTGPVYRPPGPPQPGPHQPGPPQPGPHQPGPPPPGPHQPGPHQPGPPPQVPHQQQRPGPYPPQVDQRPQPAPDQQQPPADPYQQVPWGTDGTPTAEEFARRRLAKPAEPTATMGARAILQKGTMGLVRLAPGKYEREFKQDVEMVRRNFGGLRQVTIVNPKGGAGKTVAVLLLAMTFGQKRGGYVLAWDNNETQGTLGMRAQQDFHARTVRDMMRDLHLFRGSHGRVGDLSQYVRAQGEGMFDVLASDESATAGEMLTASAFAEIREIVSRFYKLIFVDTGNNVRAQNWQAAMDATDQLVITMSARNDSAETAARMLDHLEQSGRQRLVRQAVSVVTMPTTRKDIDLPAIQRHFAARTRAVLLAPYEKLIDSGEPIRYAGLSAGTKDAWLKIAAAVAEGL
ncbi:ParA family protein [Actinoplanes sp. NBRC 103695]|uniref:MinD/ParA family ATP-binding protein n=1 Tax=Actinoplanes sp. NBRC 103695 TaxID=3032202 RepID=UPI0025559FB9|nr:ParA family protein [Actinoplanes sp. NBRC 103695]